MSSLISSFRFNVALDRWLEADAGVELLSWRWFRRHGDGGIEAQAKVEAGSFGIRVDAEPADVVTLSPPSTGPVRVALPGLAAGAHTLKVVALENGSILSLLEIDVVRIEIR